MARKRTRRAAYQKQNQNKVAMMLVTAVLLMLVAVVSVKKIELREKQQAYIEKEQELQTKIDAEEARSEELEEYSKYTQTRKYVEDIAKEKLGLVYEDEIIFKSDN